MSCGQQPTFDDICAGDRLGHMLNKVRATEHTHETHGEAGGHHTPGDSRSTDQRSTESKVLPTPTVDVLIVNRAGYNTPSQNGQVRP